MKTFNKPAIQPLAEISSLIGDSINIEGRICEVFQKAQVVREGWGTVLSFEVYDSEKEKSYKLFASGFYGTSEVDICLCPIVCFLIIFSKI